MDNVNAKILESLKQSESNSDKYELSQSMNLIYLKILFINSR
jgi:hypothetical protein